ncbi:5327_t:CDS:2, partial [Paraglomus occultum]
MTDTEALNIEEKRADLDSSPATIDVTPIDHTKSDPSFLLTEKETVVEKTDLTDNDEILARLIQMGFDFTAAELAVRKTKDGGFNAALQFVIKQQNGVVDNKHSEKDEKDPNQATFILKSTPTSRQPFRPKHQHPSLMVQPKKGILKPPSQPTNRPLWKRDWLSTINTRIQNAAAASSTNTSTSSFFASALKKLNNVATVQEQARPDKSESVSLQQRYNSSSSSLDALDSDDQKRLSSASLKR